MLVKKLRSFWSRLFPYYNDVSNHVVFLRSSLFTEEAITARRRIYKSLSFSYLCILSLGLPKTATKDIVIFTCRYDLGINHIKFPVSRHLVHRSMFTLSDQSYCFRTRPMTISRRSHLSWLNSYQYYNIKLRRDFQNWKASCFRFRNHSKWSHGGSRIVDMRLAPGWLYRSVFAGLQVPNLTLSSTGIYFWKRYVVSLCVNFSYAMYLRYFPMKSKVWLRGNFSPPNYRLELWRWTGFPTSSTLCPRSVWLLVFFAIKKFPTNLLILRDLWQS